MSSTRNTQQKKIILQTLMCSDHPTASQLYEIIGRDHPTISRATVFRVLAQFSEAGLINKLNLADGNARFDACTKPHAHLYCVDCGKVFDVEKSELESVLCKKQLGEFEIFSSKIEFVGRCKNCKQKPN